MTMTPVGWANAHPRASLVVFKVLKLYVKDEKKKKKVSASKYRSQVLAVGLSHESGYRCFDELNISIERLGASNSGVCHASKPGRSVYDYEIGYMTIQDKFRISKTCLALFNYVLS